MEQNKGTRVLSLVALCVALVGVGLGFAAFSNTLSISTSADVKPDANTFNVDFSSSQTEVLAGEVTGVADTGATGGKATIVNDSASTASITGLKASFTNVGQSVTYTFYVHNVGQYDAFLNSITYGGATSSTSNPKEFKVCKAAANANGTTTNAQMIANACGTISVSVKVGNDTAVTGSQEVVNEHKLPTTTDGKVETVVVTITYAGNASLTNGGRADGAFDVEFGNISLTYGSVD